MNLPLAAAADDGEIGHVVFAVNSRQWVSQGFPDPVLRACLERFDMTMSAAVAIIEA